MKLVKAVTFAAVAVATIAIAFLSAGTASATPASSVHDAAHPASESVSPRALNPLTFAGTMAVATPDGNSVVVTVKAGQAPSVANAVRAAEADGDASAYGRVQPNSADADCDTWVSAVATPWSYKPTQKGCAVFGYTGYKQGYDWRNESDVELCTKGNGYTAAGTQTWYSAGCDGGTTSVPWGNELAYTQMEGESLSDITGAAYDWYTG